MLSFSGATMKAVNRECVNRMAIYRVCEHGGNIECVKRVTLLSV